MTKKEFYSPAQLTDAERAERRENQQASIIKRRRVAGGIAAVLLGSGVAIAGNGGSVGNTLDSIGSLPAHVEAIYNGNVNKPAEQNLTIKQRMDLIVQKYKEEMNGGIRSVGAPADEIVQKYENPDDPTGELIGG